MIRHYPAGAEIRDHCPVREAILALVDHALMEAMPNRGYHPVSLTDADLVEIAQVRVLLEVPAAGLAAETEPGDRFGELSELVGVIEQSAAAGDLSGNLQADQRFRLLLVEACGNRRLTQMVARLRDQTRLHSLPSLAASGASVASAAEHRPLTDAIGGGDRPRAEAPMRDHLAHITAGWPAVTASAGSGSNATTSAPSSSRAAGPTRRAGGRRAERGRTLTGQPREGGQ